MQGTAMENRMNGGQVHVEVFDGHRKHFDLLVTFMICIVESPQRKKYVFFGASSFRANYRWIENIPTST